ncbi:uncharacterized protein MONOS_11472 [Monocercomonoides exilis]|uniref:uncharacterized protein n=1 Tax=Monocercomonoides exilis TaxID=2049356 RepID=UPI00355A9D00|nr:hypothetical protein MONOS_11472 [Monocercomonoides exilis]|eukprot:MONOS_11472.1-p1 / transcript=MONOS_11472.1 / gene=MONOS_11472 / organism=Monocercomonoides_exilis_PA203 / gene_product=unspecified product / transcript_product=unspecified product / location=Mono_scaffold00578:13463-13880(+) / protein_length=119 / sequence_SO=supercontig / SO=protein_coding / is_pseudo=false
MCSEDKSNDDVQEQSLADKFLKLFSELEHCPESEQKVKIEEMNEIIDGMNKEEYESVFTEEMFEKILKMMEEKTLSWGNAILLLKHIGFCKALKRIWIEEFEYSSLNKRFEKIIIYEN